MQEIVLSQRDGVLAIGFNRPDKKNALTLAMYDALAQAIRAGETDAATRAIVIHGGAGSFTAGNDLQDFLRNPPRGFDSVIFRFLEAISTAQKPLIAAVEGVAVGIGTTMLLHCEFVYATPDARFALPFVNLGVVPEAASSFLLPRTAGYLKAAEWLLLGEPFGAGEAKEAGLVTAIVGAEALLDTAHGTARKLAARPAASVRATKQLMRKWMRPTIDAALREEGEVFLRMLNEPAAKEAFSAFFEKRKPDFSKLG